MVRYHRAEKYSKPKNVKELLSLALMREESSIGFYKEMAAHSFPADIIEFILELKNEELVHKAKIESKLKEQA